MGAVVEDVAEMRVAEAAGDGGAFHAEADVARLVDIFFGDGLVKTGPAGAGIELGIGVEQRGVATDAAKNAFGVVVGIFVGVGALGSGVARNRERFGRKLFAPLVFGFNHGGQGDDVFALAGVSEFDDLDGLGQVGDFVGGVHRLVFIDVGVHQCDGTRAYAEQKGAAANRPRHLVFRIWQKFHGIPLVIIIFISLPISSEGEGEGLHARVEKFNLKSAILHGSLLADQLI